MNCRIAICFWLLITGWSMAVTDEQSAQWSEIMPLAAKSLLLDIQEIAPDVVIAVGERGHVLKSTDGGLTWHQLRVPTRATLTGLDFVDANKGWVVGHDSTILYTNDGGNSWKVQYSDPEAEQPLFDVVMRSEREGFAVGAYGLMLHTNDGGKHWNIVEPSNLEDPAFGYPHFYKLHSSVNDMYLSGEAGLIAKLSGENPSGWMRIPMEYSGSFFSIAELSDGYLLTVGLRGHMYRSIDHGHTWYPIDGGVTDNFYDVAFDPDSKHVAVVGADGIVLVSLDNGQHFRRYRRTDRETINAVIWTTQGKLIGVGFGGVKDLSGFVTQALSNQ